MSLGRAQFGHRALTLFAVFGTSFLLGYFGMPTPLHAMASLGLALIGIGTVTALERRPSPRVRS
jgi:hypothetical protein